MTRPRNLMPLHMLLAVGFAALTGVTLQTLLEGQARILMLVLGLAGVLVSVLQHAQSLSRRPSRRLAGDIAGPPFDASNRATLLTCLAGVMVVSLFAGAATESALDSPGVGQIVFAVLGVLGASVGTVGYIRLLNALPPTEAALEARG